MKVCFARCGRISSPGSLPVPDLTNLDVYCDIGSELNLETAAAPTDEAYRSRYEEKLKVWHRTYPLARDTRLWKQPA